MKLIDLRSDTVTLPDKSIRRAISNAEVGDDAGDGNGDGGGDDDGHGSRHAHAPVVRYLLHI